MGQQVLEKVHACCDLRVVLIPCLDLHAIGGVGKGGAAEGALDMYVRLALNRCTQGESARHLESSGCANPNNRGVVAVDGVGPVEIGLNRVDILKPAAADDRQCRGRCVGQRVGDHPVIDCSTV